MPYHASAVEEYAPAEFAVGRMAYEGISVQRDYETARGWFELAAAHGSADAMQKLGDMYESGLGVARDQSQADEWHRKAAEKRQTTAQAALDVLWVKVPEGRYLWGMLPGSEAEQSGLRQGDIITSVGGIAVEALGQSYGRFPVIKGHVPGDRVEIEYLRDGQPAKTTVTLAPYPDDHGLARLKAFAEANGAPWAVHAVGVLHIVNAQTDKTTDGADREYAAAIPWFFKASDAGFSWSNLFLGTLYQEGRGIRKSDTDAKVYFEKAHTTGEDRFDRSVSAEAALKLGIYALNSQPPEDARALTLFREAAEGGIADGENNIGWMNENGRGVARNLDEAVRWYRLAATHGSAAAAGNLKRLGISEPVPQSTAQATSQTAAQATLDFFWIGVPEGKWLWGVLPDGAAAQAGLRNGDIVTRIEGMSAATPSSAARFVVLKDHQPGDRVTIEYLRDGMPATTVVTLAPYPSDDGLARLEQVANTGQPWAMHAIGLIHYVNAGSRTGADADREYAEAFHWFSKAADADFAYGHLLLARMYAFGRGMPKNDAQALTHYDQARQPPRQPLDRICVADAAVDLGLRALNAKPPDDRRAFALFRESAEAGWATGQYYLGWMYEHGRGVAQDRNEAIRWYRLAAARGDKAAIKSLTQLGVQP